MVVRLYVDYVLVQHVLANLFTRSYHAYERAFHVANTKGLFGKRARLRLG